MSLKTGLLATGIAMGALCGAAARTEGPTGLIEGILTGRSTIFYASLAPIPDKTHTVQKGENDWTISKKYGVTVTELHRANPGTNWRALQIGQSLVIPSKEGAVSASGGTHTVKKGENDNTIARKYGVTVAQLHAVNPGVDWRRLQIGQKLKLPGGAEDTSQIKAITTSKVKISAGTVNVRTEPTTTSAVRTSVNRGTVATVLDRQGAWYELRFPKGTVGWVRGDLLVAVAEKPAGSAPTSSAASQDTGYEYTDKASAIVDAAMGMLGVRYRWGGTSRGGVDCSGLTTLVYARNGIKLPRTSIEQSRFGDWIPKEELRAGDLVFFVTGRNTRRVNHVGIYIGDGKFVHSSSYKGRVVVTKLSDYSNGYAGARRVAALQVTEEEVVEPPPVEPEPELTLEDLFPSRIVYGADKTGR